MVFMYAYLLLIGEVRAGSKALVSIGSFIYCFPSINVNEELDPRPLHFLLQRLLPIVTPNSMWTQGSIPVANWRHDFFLFLPLFQCGRSFRSLSSTLLTTPSFFFCCPFKNLDEGFHPPPHLYLSQLVFSFLYAFSICPF